MNRTSNHSEYSKVIMKNIAIFACLCLSLGLWADAAPVDPATISADRLRAFFRYIYDSENSINEVIPWKKGISSHFVFSILIVIKKIWIQCMNMKLVIVSLLRSSVFRIEWIFVFIFIIRNSSSFQLSEKVLPGRRRRDSALSANTIGWNGFWSGWSIVPCRWASWNMFAI